MAQGNYYGLHLYDLDEYKKNRKECIIDKGGALQVHTTELNKIVNFAEFSRRFFGKSQSWFSQRLHGSLVMHKEQEFKPSEYSQIAQGYRELAKQLLQYADELDNAKTIDELEEQEKRQKKDSEK